MKLREINQKLKDPLYRNGLFLISIRVLNVLTGFIFWILAARLYSINDIGLATSLISSLGLVILFSGFGFDSSIIRFLPLNDKNKVINTCMIVPASFSLLIGLIYIFSISVFVPSLTFIQQPFYAVIILFFLLMESIITTTGRAFTALRRADYYLLQNIFLAPRILFLFPLIFLGSFGIVLSLVLANLITVFFAFILIGKFIEFRFKIDMKFIRESFRFSSGNYISSILFAVPSLILPVIVLNLCGGAEAAKYFIAFTIGNIVLIVPDALSASLFVEGSHGESLREIVTKTAKAIYIVLIPAVMAVYFFAYPLLLFFGKNYVDALELLRLLAITSLIVALFSLFTSIQNIRMKVESLVELNIIRFILLMGLSYIFILKFGIIGIGYAWMLTYLIMGLRIIQIMVKENWVYK